MKVKTENLFTTKELIEQLVKIAEEPNSVSQGWYQIVMSEAKQFIKGESKTELSNECCNCVAFDAMPRAPRCRSCDNGSRYKATEEVK